MGEKSASEGKTPNSPVKNAFVGGANVVLRKRSRGPQTRLPKSFRNLTAFAGIFEKWLKFWVFPHPSRFGLSDSSAA